MNRLIHGDSAEVLKTLETGSVDLVCTDPPYGYSFMGKDWDKAVPSVEIWKECLRVLKPGAFAFVMSAPRQDVLSQMIVRLGEAGFDTDFTSIYWTYACLSEDTEVLTQDGWKDWSQLRKSSKEDMILVYDKDQDLYSFARPERWQSYSVKDTLYRLVGDRTDQLITGNHRCLVADGGGLSDRTAQEIGRKGSAQSVVPTVEGVSQLLAIVSNAAGMETESQRTSLLEVLQRQEQDSRPSEKREASPQDVGSAEGATATSDDGREELGVEGWRDSLEETRELQADQVRPLPNGVPADGSKGQLRHGASPVRGAGNREMPDAEGSGASHQPRPTGQSAGEFDAVRNEQRSQALRTWTPCSATMERIAYDGVVYCPTTSTGYFLARRNGMMFLTGNSGFPKSANIGKMVDKRLGVEQKVVGEKVTGNGRTDEGWSGGQKTIPNTIATSPEAKALDGSYGGFQPKPAVEVIIVAMKPLSEKTYVDQALKNGKGVTWLDDARLPVGDDISLAAKNPHTKRENSRAYTDIYGEFQPSEYELPKGRFPANLLVSDDILNDGREAVGGKLKRGGPVRANLGEFADRYKNRDRSEAIMNYGDSGSYSRFFSLDAWHDALPEHVRKVFPFLIVPKAAGREKFVYLTCDCEAPKMNAWVNADQSRNETTGATSPARDISEETSEDDFDSNTASSGNKPTDVSLPATASITRTTTNSTIDSPTSNSSMPSPTNDSTEGVNSETVSGGSPVQPVENTSQSPSRTGTSPNKAGSATGFAVHAGFGASFVKSVCGNCGANVRREGHATVKPLTLMSYLVTLGSRPGDVVLDPFLGSGTTACAAKAFGRGYIGIERESEYVKIAEARIAAIQSGLL